MNQETNPDEIKETLRDKFAMAALSGILPAIRGMKSYNEKGSALEAYQIADAMMEARKK